MQKKSKQFEKELLALFEAQGLDCSKLIIGATGDLNAVGDYLTVWATFDPKGIYIAEGLETILRISKNKPPKTAYSLTKIESIPIGDVDELHIERYATTGSLIAKQGADDHLLCRFSIGMAGDFQSLCDAFNNFKQGKSVEGFSGSIGRQEGGGKKGERGGFAPPDGPPHGNPPRGGRPEPGQEAKDKKPKPPEKKDGKEKSRLWELLRFFSGYKIQMGLVLLIVMLQGLTGVLVPKLSTQALFDTVLNAGNTDPMDTRLAALLTLALSVLGLKLLSEVFNILHSLALGLVAPGVIFDLKKQIFASMQKLSLRFYSSKATGQLMERINRDAGQIQHFVIDGIPFLLVNAATLVGIVVMLFLLSWRLAVVVVAVIPILLSLSVFGDRLFRRMHHRTFAADAKLVSIVSDNINGHRVIKAFAKEDDEYERFSEISEEVKEASWKLNKREQKIFPFFTALVYILTTGVLLLGGMEVLKGRMEIGELLTFTIYLAMIQGPIGFIQNLSNWMARANDSMHRVFEVIHAEDELPENPAAQPLEPFEGSIELNELTFEYEPARPIIKNVSLKVGAGQMLGIVGKTGAGKTTIANLISRLYDPKTGAVRIDGVDVKDLPAAQLRRNIGLVSQDIYLFNGTIADNIRYADPSIGMDGVIRAAKVASCHEFIMRLPDAYETRVGASGQQLSGGERQRVSIARAILQNPKILILDEATAAMDTATERAIQESLHQLQQGRTTIAIAHRLSTLRDADMLCVIDNGELREFGSYGELLKLRGEFWKLNKIQNEAMAAIGVPIEDIPFEVIEEEGENQAENQGGN
ncbi:MAG: ABC transporter ATP-binding protein/permease [Oscillospiraceae bacterium]|jgi:ATP-binding cassette subfamily B protein|nr:ABC transporter ATP-binding protein/permease [Oscillospiraceae bacterium]